MTGLAPGVDEEQAFVLYATFLGDPAKTAATLGVPVSTVVKAAAEGGWMARIAPIVALQGEGSTPARVERSINRAINFTQAYRLRRVAEKALRHLSDMSPEQLIEFFSTEATDKQGNVKVTRTLRPLADLAVVFQKCHEMSYSALTDSVSERVKRPPEPEDSMLGSAALHCRLADAMAKGLKELSPALDLQREQADIAESQRTVKGAIAPESVRKISLGLQPNLPDSAT